MSDERRLPEPLDINTISEAIRESRAKVVELPGGREKALVMTKLDEALMWLDKVPTYRW